MIPELGLFAIILALSCGIIQCVIPLLHAVKFKHHPAFYSLTKIAVICQVSLLSFAMLLLIYSFIQNDMSVIYVREHSHHLLPLIYRMAAAWGGHEGSLLLWCLIIGLWTSAFVIWGSKQLTAEFHDKVLMVLGIISVSFISFMLFTSNPFKRDFPLEFIQGNDLSPLLQDSGLLFHPPSLYFGYVGFAIAFAFAIAALMEGELNKNWVKACRPWVILPWAYLGCGIILGSWWAYRELGWGGWWFWDPVENASLLPWLSATGLIHSLIVSEKRNVFKGWTILLALITFSLSLIGTFLVRSGILVSVHTFANDPGRGIFLLILLTGLVSTSFLLYMLRIHRFFKPPEFQFFSREAILLINSIVLLTLMASIILGTIYPIVLETLGLEKISVGEPYFNTIFLPIILPLLLLMAIAPYVHWEQYSLKILFKKLHLSFILCLCCGIFLPILLGFKFKIYAAIGLSVGFWILVTSLQHMFSLKKSTLKHYSMIIAHIGVAIMVIGISVNKSYSKERQIKIRPHEEIAFAGFTFTFNRINQLDTKNYQSAEAEFLVNHSQKILAEERIYKSHGQIFSRPGIQYNAFRDLYIALGSAFTDGSWSVRIYYKPFVRLIWLGGFFIILGGLLSLIDKRKNIS